MTPVTSFAGKRVAVFGLGGSGLVSCRALANGGAAVIACDDDPQKMQAAAAEGIATADLRAADWTSFDALVLAPGVPLTHPRPHWVVGLARRHGTEIIGDIELFARERRHVAPGAPFVAVTGTNGKSTTTALIAHILRQAGKDVQMGGNIGTAILSLAPPARRRYHVIECSSYQIDLAPTLDPSVGILMNVTEDHLDRHGTMENYAAVKERLVAGAEVAVIGVDDAQSAAIAQRLRGEGRRVELISVHERVVPGVSLLGTRLYRTGAIDGLVADLAGIPSLRGVHNAQNAAAAAAALLALNIHPDALREGLRSFPGLAHRMEELGRIGRALFVNDSKATNADSAAKALACFGDIFWILGGKPKTGGIESLAEFFPRIRKAYLIGESVAEFARTLDGRVAYETCGTLERAVPAAAREAAESPLAEPVVLLSPACASFDQYPNFEVRGDAFRKLVLALPGFASKGSAPAR